MRPMPTSSDSAGPRGTRFRRAAEVMARISLDLGRAADVHEVLRITIAATKELVDFDGGVVSLIEGNTIGVAASHPELPPDVRSLRVHRGEGISGKVVQSGTSAIVGDLRSDERIAEELRRAGERAEILSVVVVPLVSTGQVIGTLQVNAREPHAFDDDDRVILEMLAGHVAVAIESARRYSAMAELELMKHDFIARVSHELRTPITIIAGFVHTLLTNDERLQQTERRQLLERVDSATARLSGLIDELLTLVRLDAGVVDTQPRAVAVAPLLESVRREARAPEAVTVAAGDELELVTDPSLLLRALGMLVDNALKYAGGCELVASDRRVEVVDHGPGIPDELRPRVFELFVRATQHTAIPGLGLGLPMARTLIAAAGGELSMGEPPHGGGTRMVVEFP